MGFPWGTVLRIRWGMWMASAALTICALLVPSATESFTTKGAGSGAGLIVQLEPDAKMGDVRALVRRAGGSVTRDLHLINALGVRVGPEVAERLARHPDVRWVSPNAEVTPSGIDASQLSTAYNESIRSTSVWNFPARDRSSVGAGVGVAVVDTGIERDLPDFRVSRTDHHSRVIASAVVNPDATNAGDDHGHGTHVAGIIAGNGTARDASDPLYGRYVGVAPGANLISIKAADDEGNATTIDVIEGLQYAVDHKDEWGIRVVNLSLSEDRPQSYKTNPLNAAVEQAWNAGIVVVAAAGNRGSSADAVHYAPGNDPFVITAGASDDRGTASRKDDVAASWSSSGTTQDGHAKPDLLAPGAHITSTLSPGSEIESMCSSCVVGGGYFRMGGSSMASAVVSGAVALMLENDPSLTPDETKSAIRRNLKDAPGAGSVLDVLAADRASTQELTEQNSFEPNKLLDPTTGLIDYARSSWSRSSWSRSSWSRSSWSRSSWSASFAK